MDFQTLRRRSFQSSLFDPTSYRSVHNLATNTDKRHFEDLIKKTAEAVFMAKVTTAKHHLLMHVHSVYT